MRGAWLLLCALALHAGDAGLVLTCGGMALPGPVQVTAGGVVAGAATVPWGELAAFAQPGTPATAIAGGIVTVEGEIWRGLPLEITPGVLRWSGDRCGERCQPLDGLSAIILGPLHLAALAGHLADEPGAVLANGERLAGTLTFLNGEALGLDTGKRIAQVARARVTAVVLRATRPAAAPRTWLQLVTGERVLLGSLPAPAPAALDAGWSEGPGCRQLASWPPRRAVAADRQAAALPVGPGLGFPATVGGLATPTGVRLPARGEIAWDCAGYANLVAWAACAAGADATAAAVAVDGAVVWERILQPGAPAVAVAVPLRGGAEVALRSAPAADGETARREVVWGMPALTR